MGAGFFDSHYANFQSTDSPSGGRDGKVLKNVVIKIELELEKFVGSVCLHQGAFRLGHENLMKYKVGAEEILNHFLKNILGLSKISGPSVRFFFRARPFFFSKKKKVFKPLTSHKKHPVSEFLLSVGSHSLVAQHTHRCVIFGEDGSVVRG